MKTIKMDTFDFIINKIGRVPEVEDRVEVSPVFLIDLLNEFYQSKLSEVTEKDMIRLKNCCMPTWATPAREHAFMEGMRSLMEHLKNK